MCVVFVCVSLSLPLCMFLCMCVCLCVYACVYMYMYMYVCMCIDAYICKYMYVYVCQPCPLHSLRVFNVLCVCVLCIRTCRCRCNNTLSIIIHQLYIRSTIAQVQHGKSKEEKAIRSGLDFMQQGPFYWRKSLDDVCLVHTNKRNVS